MYRLYSIYMYKYHVKMYSVCIQNLVILFIDYLNRGAGWGGGARIRYSIKKIVLIRDSISEISP